jgi:hypothetical protein
MKFSKLGRGGGMAVAFMHDSTRPLEPTTTNNDSQRAGLAHRTTPSTHCNIHELYSIMFVLETRVWVQDPNVFDRSAETMSPTIEARGWQVTFNQSFGGKYKRKKEFEANTP